MIRLKLFIFSHYCFSGHFPDRDRSGSPFAREGGVASGDHRRVRRHHRAARHVRRNRDRIRSGETKSCLRQLLSTWQQVLNVLNVHLVTEKKPWLTYCRHKIYYPLSLQA